MNSLKIKKILASIFLFGFMGVVISPAVFAKTVTEAEMKLATENADKNKVASPLIKILKKYGENVKVTNSRGEPLHFSDGEKITVGKWIERKRNNNYSANILKNFRERTNLSPSSGKSKGSKGDSQKSKASSSLPEYKPIMTEEYYNNNIKGKFFYGWIKDKYIKKVKLLPLGNGYQQKEVEAALRIALKVGDNDFINRIKKFTRGKSYMPEIISKIAEYNLKNLGMRSPSEEKTSTEVSSPTDETQQTTQPASTEPQPMPMPPPSLTRQQSTPPASSDVRPTTNIMGMISKFYISAIERYKKDWFRFYKGKTPEEGKLLKVYARKSSFRDKSGNPLNRKQRNLVTAELNKLVEGELTNFSVFENLDPKGDFSVRKPDIRGTGKYRYYDLDNFLQVVAMFTSSEKDFYALASTEINGKAVFTGQEIADARKIALKHNELLTEDIKYSELDREIKFRQVQYQQIAKILNSPSELAKYAENNGDGNGEVVISPGMNPQVEIAKSKLHSKRAQISSELIELQERLKNSPVAQYRQSKIIIAEKLGQLQKFDESLNEQKQILARLENAYNDNSEKPNADKEAMDKTFQPQIAAIKQTIENYTAERNELELAITNEVYNTEDRKQKSALLAQLPKEMREGIADRIKLAGKSTRLFAFSINKILNIFGKGSESSSDVKPEANKPDNRIIASAKSVGSSTTKASQTPPVMDGGQSIPVINPPNGSNGGNDSTGSAGQVSGGFLFSKFYKQVAAAKKALTGNKKLNLTNNEITRLLSLPEKDFWNGKYYDKTNKTIDNFFKTAKELGLKAEELSPYISNWIKVEQWNLRTDFVAMRRVVEKYSDLLTDSEKSDYTKWVSNFEDSVVGKNLKTSIDEYIKFITNDLKDEDRRKQIIESILKYMAYIKPMYLRGGKYIKERKELIELLYNNYADYLDCGFGGWDNSVDGYKFYQSIASLLAGYGDLDALRIIKAKDSNFHKPEVLKQVALRAITQNKKEVFENFPKIKESITGTFELKNEKGKIVRFSARELAEKAGHPELVSYFEDLEKQKQ